MTDESKPKGVDVKVAIIGDSNVGTRFFCAGFDGNDTAC